MQYNYSIHVLITVLSDKHVIRKIPEAPLHYLPFCKVKWSHFEGMWHILHASFWKFSKLLTVEFLSNWSIIDEVRPTTCNTTAYFWPTLYVIELE